MAGIDAETLTKWRRALTKESDRGCGLLAAAYLDDALYQVFQSIFAEPDTAEPLFGAHGPLATFSSRISLAYQLGLIAELDQRDLTIIRRIRNEFAHSAEPLTFETDSIADRCRTLRFHNLPPSSPARTLFTRTVFGLLAHLHKVSIHADPQQKLPERKLSHNKMIWEAIMNLAVDLAAELSELPFDEFMARAHEQIAGERPLQEILKNRGSEEE